MSTNDLTAGTRPALCTPPARWSIMAAHAIPLLALPSSVWRILLGCGVTMGASRASLEADGMPGRGTVAVVMMSVVAEAAALLSLGLVRPWGEAVPRWVPALGARRIPRSAVAVPAVAGGIILTALWGYTVVGLFGVEEIRGTGWRLLLYACYAPTLLWGPLLLVLTWAY
jgi:hypothetical protein